MLTAFKLTEPIEPLPFLLPSALFLVNPKALYSEISDSRRAVKVTRAEKAYEKHAWALLLLTGISAIPPHLLQPRRSDYCNTGSLCYWAVVTRFQSADDRNIRWPLQKGEALGLVRALVRASLPWRRCLQPVRCRIRPGTSVCCRTIGCWAPPPLQEVLPEKVNLRRGSSTGLFEDKSQLSQFIGSSGTLGSLSKLFV